MSNRKKPQPPKPEQWKASLPNAPTFFCEQIEYQINGQITELRFGRNGQTAASVVVQTNLFLDVLNKFQETVISLARAAAAQQPPAPPAEEPKEQ